ncbi:MAG: hypothetical protein L7G94_06575 [Acidilobus sp.]|nr:hypothetical protein [Acidilobus sp.]
MVSHGYTCPSKRREADDAHAGLPRARRGVYGKARPQALQDSPEGPLSFLSISSYTTELIRSENPSARIYYIGNGIDSEAFYPRKVDKGSELTVSVILRRANLKGPDLAVQALNMAYRRVKFRVLLISEFSEGGAEAQVQARVPLRLL